LRAPARTIAVYQGKKNRRLESSRPPGAEEGFNKLLDHAKHDRTDKGESDICGNNAQSAGESHGKPPWFASLPVVTLKATKPFQREKVSAAVARHISPAGGVVKES
jgi:hypothetical protein